MMEKKVRNALLLFGALLPGKVKDILIELASEVDRLRDEVNALRSNQSKG
jgi:hypothetical protein